MLDFIAAALTDTGNVREINQDGICIKISDRSNHRKVAMAVICDGMGGFSKGELASATLIRRFSNWYEEELPLVIDKLSIRELSSEWEKIIDSQNRMIMEYGKSVGIKLGTTISALLILDEKYMSVHIGDSRIYRISDDIEQITEDHTLVAREVSRGNLSEDEAKRDKRKHVLLQCVGASRKIVPNIEFGNINSDTLFLLCSDGLYNTVNIGDLFNLTNIDSLKSIGDLRMACSYMIETAKKNGERDNISVAMIKCINS